MTKFTKISVVVVSAACLSFFARNKPIPIFEEDLSEKSSVTIVAGKYQVDSAVIRYNRNKKMLLDLLSRSYIVEKKSKEEIPVFIKTFLDNISCGRKFEIAGPGENWVSETDIVMAYGIQIIKKVYDPIKKDSVIVLVWDTTHYPNKQLAFFGIGKNIAILSYYTGSWQQMNVIKFEGEKIVDFWYGGFNPLNGTTRAEIIKQIKEASVRKNDGC